LFFSQAQPGEIDRQGRLRIPPELATFAGLTSELVVVGVRDRIEIWDAAGWDAFLGATQAGYDSLAEQVLGEAKRIQTQQG
jgi:MraZ protein